VKVDLPALVQGVRLDEVRFGVNVETVLGCMGLDLGHESGDVNSCHYDTATT
jgi:hypothetical protein